MGAVSTLLKGLFLLFNFVFWALGLALLVVGILAKVSFGYIMKLSTDINYDLAPLIMMCCGAFILLVGFMGCWGSIKEHPWALKLYMFILIILFLVEIVGAIAGYVLRGKLDKSIKKAFVNGVDNYHTKGDIQDAMDLVQQKIGCCGVTTYKDYFNKAKPTAVNATKPPTGESVPKSCCINSKGTGCAFADMKGKNATEAGIYATGCYNTVFQQTKKNVLIIAGVALGVALFQVLGVFTAFKLIQRFKKNYEKM